MTIKQVFLGYGTSVGKGDPRSRAQKEKTKQYCTVSYINVKEKDMSELSIKMFLYRYITPYDLKTIVYCFMLYGMVAFGIDLYRVVLFIARKLKKWNYSSF